MDIPALTARPFGLALLFDRRRLRFTLLFSTGIGLLLGLGWQSGLLSLLLRTTIIGVVALLAFGLFEQWPRRLPAWCARRVLQVVAVGVSMPLSVFTIYVLSTDAGAPPFWAVEDRLTGFGLLTFLSTLLAPWAALTALVRQKDALARHQALAFELEKSQLERKALDARVELRGEHCVARVSDTGIGLHANGTGLATLHERLRLVYGEGVALRISALEPRGVCAEIELPVRGVPA